ncbi:MAG TPA: hypothetical protein VHP37_15795 [Burkholderiales bacterium]|nr:hypothetical protein [Burkholderiales bacterium]
MDTASETLEARLSRLLGWERRKRYEATLVVALFYTFLAALAVPLFVTLPSGWAWAPPAAMFAAIAPYLLYARRWREPDTTRALAALDRKLHLDERATTAWELLRRDETKAVALLVLREAADRMRSFDPRALFPRAWGWHAWLLLPIFALWLAMLHFDTRFGIHGVSPRQQPALARELRELARELAQKAQSEALPKTLAAARELEKIARRGLETGTTQDGLERELGDFRNKLASQTSGGRDPGTLPTSRRELSDLRAELEAARESFNAGDSEAQDWQQRLAGLTRLQKQLDAPRGGSRELSRGELKALVDKLEQDATAELDRRALADAEQSLKALTQRERGRPGDPRGRAGGDDPKKDGRAERWDPNIPGNSPGNAPGEKRGAPSLPEAQGARRAQLKGEIGEGERSSTFFKAVPKPGTSRLTRDEVITSYRRQAEAELATERIPEDLRDTVKNYFLSLEQTK